MTDKPEREAPLRAGQLARLVGVTPDTLRHYERVGVLPAPPRGSNGYRIYPPDAAVRVKWIQHALAVGFTLEELARILKVRDSDYDGRMREIRITEGGIQLLDTFVAESRVVSGGGLSQDPRFGREE